MRPGHRPEHQDQHGQAEDGGRAVLQQLQTDVIGGELLGCDARAHHDLLTSSSPWAAATPALSSPASATRSGYSDDPAGLDVAAVRPVRDESERCVLHLNELEVPARVSAPLRPPVLRTCQEDTRSTSVTDCAE